VEFCLTKLQALHATSLTFATLHLIDVLNAFGLFARAKRDRPEYTRIRANQDPYLLVSFLETLSVARSEPR